jgi:hypothetical protein
VPGVVVPSGSVTVTRSPARTCDCWEASRGTITTCRSEVAANTGPDAGLPRLPVTWLTRIASGSNTTCPSGSDPDGEETPRCDRSFSTPAAVFQEKYSQPSAETSALSASPRVTRSWFSWETSSPVTPSSRLRHAGTLPYSSITGDPLSVLYSVCP